MRGKADEIKQLRDALAECERRASEATARAVSAERSAHKVVEQIRYVLEAAAEAECAKYSGALGGIGHVLPYVFSGRRHWSEPSPPEYAAENVSTARRIASSYGFELPGDPTMAVTSLLDVAAMLLNPKCTLPVEGWQGIHPLRNKVDCSAA